VTPNLPEEAVTSFRPVRARIEATYAGL